MAITEVRERAPSPEGVRARPRSGVSSLVVGGVVALLTLPSLGIMPKAGLDFSWAAALHLAAHRRVPFGSGVVFTYGPLGFLSVPIPYFVSTWILSLAYVCALQVSLCVGLVSSLRRSLGLVLATVASFALATVGRVLGPTELALALFVAACLLVLERHGSALLRRGPQLVALGGGIAGVHLLVKFNTGLAMLLVGAITAWVIGRGRWRSEATFGAAATSSFLAGWLLTGNHLTDIGLYLSRSLQVASGYSEAMGTEQPGRASEYVFAALVVGLVAVLTWASARRLPRGPRVATALVVGAWLFLALKHGFVRHDTHSVVFFAEALIVASCSCRTATWRLPTFGVLCVLALGVAAVSHAGPGDLIDPTPDPFGSIADAARVVTPHRLGVSIEQTRARLRAEYGLEATTLAELEGRSVHIHPMEATIAWAYPELDWKPLPVFQAYSAYTHGLDDANAAALTSPDGPQRILAARVAVDGRNPGWESPAAVRAMACNYVEVGRQGKWQVLARAADRCGREAPIGSVNAVVGRPVTIPIPGPVAADQMVVARISGLDASPLYRLRAQLTKIPPVYLVVDGTRSYRLVPGTAGDGLVLSAPANSVGWSPPFAFPDSVHRLEIRGGGFAVGDHVRIELTAVTVTPGTLGG